MATGGGEKFSTFAPFPKDTAAIEGYPPNVEIAKKKLEPLGVKVFEASETKVLPFPDNKFDLVLNRHGGFNIKELYRILKPEGQFFTQQVGGDNLAGLQEFFNQTPKWPDLILGLVKPKFEEQGFTIKESQEWKGKVTFKDAGAIVYFLKAVPWIVDNFGVDSHLKYLNKLQARLEKEGKLEFIYSRYVIWAIKRMPA